MDKEDGGNIVQSNSLQSPSLLASILEYSQEDFLLNLAEKKEKRPNKKLLKNWKNAANNGVLNYDIGKSNFRQLDGPCRISVQLNVDRCQKRRKPHEFQAIDEPFDPERWNFTKLKPEEFIFHMVRRQPKESANFGLLSTGENVGQLAINASPLSLGHSLLIPSPQARWPQILNAEAMKMAVELMLLCECEHMLIIYNSLMAHASVNHLHLQTLFWPTRSGIMAQKPIAKPTKCSKLFLLERPHWYLPAFVFQLLHQNSIDELSNSIEKCVQLLIDQNVAHNLFMCRSGRIQTEIGENCTEKKTMENMEEKEAENNENKEFVTIYLFPRRILKEGLNPDGPFVSSFVPAALEVAGLVPVYNREYFESVTEKDILDQFNKYEMITDQQFQHLADSLVERLIK